MNIFGLEVSISRKSSNNKTEFVKEAFCANARSSIEQQIGSLGQRMDDLRSHLDTRFEDMKDFITNNGK